MFLFFLSRLVRRAKWSIAITLRPTSALYVSTFFSKTIGPNSTKIGSDYPWWWKIIALFGYSFTEYGNIKRGQRYRHLWASSFVSLTSIWSFDGFSVRQKWWIHTSSGKRNNSVSGYCLFVYLFVIIRLPCYFDDSDILPF